MSADQLEHRPTRFSTAVVVSVTLLVTAVLVVEVELVRRVLYGVAGTLALAAVLWLLSSERWRPVGAALGSAVFPIVGLSLLAGTGYTVAAQLRNTIPVGSVFLVIGATVAVFGAVLAVRDVLDESALVRCLGTGMRATLVVGSAMTLAVLIRFATLSRQISETARTVETTLLSPTAMVPLASFLFVVAVAVYVTRAAVRSLPVAELLGDRLDGGTRRSLAALDRYLVLAAPPLLLLLGVTVLLEFTSQTPYAWLPSALANLAGGVTGATPLRLVLVGVAGVSLASLALTRALRQSYQTSVRGALIAVVPYLGGLGLSAAAVWFHDPFLSAVTEAVSRRLPLQLRGPFEDVTAEVLSFYGGTVVALVVVTATSLLTLVVVFGLLLSVVSGLLSERASGVSLAAGGLFLAAGFAATLGVSLPLALLGVLASLLVWDVGEYGVTMGTELAAGAGTTRTELVHAGGTVFVGAGTVGLAFLVEWATVDVQLGGVPLGPALVVTVAGLLLLALASQ